MANEHYEEALKGLPCRVSSLSHLIHQVICYRYDTREIVNGKPNRGYRKSYPGMPELMQATGKTRQACNTAIEALISNKIIDRVTIGRPGRQAEYRPIYVLAKLGEHVNLTLHVAKPYKSKKLAEHVNPAEQTRQVGLPNVSSKLDTISTISNHKYDKYSINVPRFNKLLTYIPKDFHIYIKPGTNYEKKLDELERRGTSLEAVGANLSKRKWDTAGAKGGLLSWFLDDLMRDKHRGEGGSKARWCEAPNCDPITRTWPEPSEINGRLDDRCPKCNDQLLHELDNYQGQQRSNVLEELGAQKILKAIDI
jgi:hypothetical protein